MRNEIQLIKNPFNGKDINIKVVNILKLSDKDDPDKAGITMEIEHKLFPPYHLTQKFRLFMELHKDLVIRFGNHPKFPEFPGKSRSIETKKLHLENYLKNLFTIDNIEDSSLF